MKTEAEMIPSLLKAFVMLELRLIGDKEKNYVIVIRCINSKKETGLYLINITFDELITKCVSNEILHHFGM